MKINTTRIPFGKALLSALFVGILATGICFVYDIWFRLATNYGPSYFINVSSIIFIVNILLLVAGVAYYGLKSWLKKGDMVYAVCFLLVFIYCLHEIAGIQRFADLKLNREFIQLLSGITIIIGIAVLSVPFFNNIKKLNGYFYEMND